MQGLKYAHIMSRLVNRPLLIHPRNAQMVYNVLAAREGMGLFDGVEPRASRFEGDMLRNENGGFPSVEPFKLAGDTGVVSVTGELVNRGAWIGADSGLTSYEGIGFQLTRAARSAKTKAILLDIDSPGGEAIGAMELAAKVARINETKPVYAVVNGMAASAAYALVSGARRIITGPTGVTGSIGVVLLHLDRSKELEAKGITPTLIFAGAHKVDGNPFAPLSEEVEGELQKEVNSFYQQFIDQVAAGRGRRLSKKAARETEARSYLGADAVSAGLADAVGTFDEVLDELRSAQKRRASRSQQGATSMARLTDDGETAITLEDHTRAVDTARADGRRAAEAEADGRVAAAEAASSQAAAAERGRIGAILADERIKGRESFALKMAIKFPTANADDIAELCAEAPGPQPGADLAARAAATGVDRLTHGLHAQQTADEASRQAIAEGRKRANEQANSRFGEGKGMKFARH